MTLRLIHLSDIHFNCENTAAVAAAAQFVRASAFDLLVVSGDITQWGRRDEFESASAWLRTLPAPHLLTPGNHDTPWFGLAQRVFAPFGRYERVFGPSATAAFEGPGLRVRALNSARGWQVRLNWSKGHVSKAQSNEACDELCAAHHDAYRILVCHHPLLEEPGEPITSQVRGGHRAARALNAAGVDVVISGHLHMPFVHPLPYGDKRTFAVGAGTLSQRERGSPPSFNVIEFEGMAMTVTMMAWDGERLAPARSWTVYLRPRTAPEKGSV
ncbi:MAG: metallophosphoesterase [Alphaproteobacteria bacterium]